MKTAKSNRDEIRKNSLTIPMNKEEKDTIQRKADEMGLSMSAFARMVFKDFMRKEVQ
jgi:antitoxin component of RelBE/YafQ-DinJ toxin-antitoxin module